MILEKCFVHVYSIHSVHIVYLLNPPPPPQKKKKTKKNNNYLPLSSLLHWHDPKWIQKYMDSSRLSLIRRPPLDIFPEEGELSDDQEANLSDHDQSLSEEVIPRNNEGDSVVHELESHPRH